MLALALVGLAGCSGDDSPATTDDETTAGSPSTPATPSSTAPTEEPREESSAAEAQPGEVSPAEFAQVMRTALDKATTARVTMSLGGQVAYRATGVIDLTGKSPATRITMTINGQQLETVVVDNVVYLKGLAPGGKYFKMDLDDPSNPLAGSLTDQLDLASQFKVFRRALIRAELVGTEGDLDHYRIRLDAQKMLQSLKLPAGAGTPSLPPELEFDMYFDPEGLIRRVTGDLGALGGQFQVAYSDWGAPVNIKKPPADQVLRQPQPGRLAG